jgi:hypothetical protein
MGLLDIIRGKQLSANTGSATAIHATHELEPREVVAKVAVAQSHDDKNSVPPADQIPNQDQFCWPNSSAMNSGEIDKFKYRLEIFQAKGLDELNAEALADKLVLRDRGRDDRNVCYECRYMKGISSLRCENWRLAGIAMKSSDAFLGKDFAMMLQRCHGFGL